MKTWPPVRTVPRITVLTPDPGIVFGLSFRLSSHLSVRSEVNDLAELLEADLVVLDVTDADPDPRYGRIVERLSRGGVRVVFLADFPLELPPAEVVRRPFRLKDLATTIQASLAEPMVTEEPDHEAVTTGAREQNGGRSATPTRPSAGRPPPAPPRPMVEAPTEPDTSPADVHDAADVVTPDSADEAAASTPDEDAEAETAASTPDPHAEASAFAPDTDAESEADAPVTEDGLPPSKPDTADDRRSPRAWFRRRHRETESWTARSEPPPAPPTAPPAASPADAPTPQAPAPTAPTPEAPAPAAHASEAPAPAAHASEAPTSEAPAAPAPVARPRPVEPPPPPPPERAAAATADTSTDEPAPTADTSTSEPSRTSDTSTTEPTAAAHTADRSPEAESEADAAAEEAVTPAADQAPDDDTVAEPDLPEQVVTAHEPPDLAVVVTPSERTASVDEVTEPHVLTSFVRQQATPATGTGERESIAARAWARLVGRRPTDASSPLQQRVDSVGSATAEIEQLVAEVPLVRSLPAFLGAITRTVAEELRADSAALWQRSERGWVPVEHLGFTVVEAKSSVPFDQPLMHEVDTTGGAILIDPVELVHAAVAGIGGAHTRSIMAASISAGTHRHGVLTLGRDDPFVAEELDQLAELALEAAYGIAVAEHLERIGGIVGSHRSPEASETATSTARRSEPGG